MLIEFDHLAQKYRTLSVEIFLSQMAPFKTQEAYSVTRTMIAFFGPNFRHMLENWLLTKDADGLSRSARQELEFIACAKRMMLVDGNAENSFLQGAVQQ